MSEKSVKSIFMLRSVPGKFEKMEESTAFKDMKA